MEEIWAVVTKMGPFTSPGPDGYSPVFYKRSVGVHIAVIPKIKSPDTPSDYRPISLSNVLYKIVAKKLVKQTRAASGRICILVAKCFCAWSPDFLGIIFIAKELLHFMHNSRAVNGHFDLKVDIVKAYDRVNWKFLGDMLHIMGISGTAHSLIKACVMSTSFCINIDGSSQGFYKSERGIPLSPTLFIICSQGLSLLMQQFESQGTKDIKSTDGINVFNLKKLLQQYASMSGQLTDNNKSAIYFSKGISDLSKQTTMQDLGVREMVSDDKYIGIFPLKSDFRIASFNYLIEKFTSRLPGWRFGRENGIATNYSEFLFTSWDFMSSTKGCYAGNN
ncbi:uncharacterized protein LOC113359269 [Papaver somniferum]|uniref:uncharacterized protein LOC113359269 n=1 Tax=Papaver somniferum TaxID=3469 RepID=UPI000E6FEDFC|nr:uncharacterized protein LOC113359269 [Papaver somniferum]